MKNNVKPKADLAFEVSWEACNKVGGIFTVLSSKARQMQEYYGDNYCLIGPYFIKATKSVFKEKSIPKEYKKIYNELEKIGIVCHFGEWLVKGEPKVILIDFKNFWLHIDGIKEELWNSFGIDSLDAPYDFNEPVLWSWTAGILLEKIAKANNGKKIVVHGHEWLSGGTILYLKKNNANVSTVFTTHATTLGRTLAGHGKDLYSILDKINPDEEAYKYNVQAKHNMEKAVARSADIFTTVSQVTGMETERLLEKKADIILPNGLDMSKFPSFEETALKHKMFRNKLRKFILYYFFPYYDIDLKNTLLFFTASRYEFHNKGLDIMIKSLGKLNEKMKKNKNKKTIVTFFWVPTGISCIKPEIIEAREEFQDIEDLLEENKDNIRENLLYTVTSEKKINEKSILGEELIFKMKRKLLQLKSKNGVAPLSTHNILDNGNDSILKAFKEIGLENKKEDKVKVIFYPIYLTGADGLGDLDYYQSIQACHLGIFPSYYEPWGYTPLETAALGVSSLTSNLSGFGKYFYDKLNGKKVPGINILDIENEERENVINDFVDILYKFTLFSKKERIDNKIKAREIAFMANWKEFVKYYIKAHNRAIDDK